MPKPWRLVTSPARNSAPVQVSEAAIRHAASLADNDKRTMSKFPPQMILIPVIAFLSSVAHAQILNEEGGLSAPAVAPTTVTGGGPYIIVVSDFDRSVEFYNAVLDMEPASGNLDNYVSNAAISTLYNANDGEFRNANYSLPDTALALELIEWRGVPTPASTDDQIFDAGSTKLLVFVKDIDAAIGAALSNGGTMLTPSGVPVSGGPFTAAVVRDPDGFYVELVELSPAPETGIEGNAIHGRFRLSVTDAELTAEFFREVFGFEIPSVGEFNDDPLLGEMTGLGVARNRVAFTMIPGSNINFEIIEYVVDDRQRVRYRLPAPGSPVLRLLFDSLEDLEDALQRARYAGATLADNNVTPVALVENVLMITIEDPNGLFLELATGF